MKVFLMGENMRRYLRQLEQAAFKRAFVQVTKPILEEAINSNLDQNSAAKRILKVIHRIPGFSLAANVLFSAGGEFLAEHADELWPGDTRPYTVALRGILRQAGPLIVGAADATADTLDALADTAADRVVSNPGATRLEDQKAMMDAIYFFVRDGKKYLVIPLRNPATWKIMLDDLGDPIPTNAEVHEVYNHEDYTKPVMRTEKAGQDGKQTKQVKGPPAKKRTLLGPLTPLEAAQQNLFDLSRFPIEEADEIKKLLRPKPSWESLISPDVDRVLSWLVDVLSLATLSLNAVERQEIEDLVQKMKQQKPEPEWVNKRLGRFRVEVSRFPLHGRRTYNDAQLAQIRTLLSRIRDEIDITLEGEQSLTTKARKGLEAAPDVLRQVGEILSSSTPWVVRGLLWWRNAVIIAFVLLLIGILAPVAAANTPVFTLAVFLCAIAGGSLGFAITWPLPIFQKVYDFLQEFISGYSQDSINSLGRKVASFALCVGAGVLPLTIWLEFPVFSRASIVAFGGLFPIGIMFALKEAGYPDLAQRLAKRSLLVANAVFGTFAVLLFAFVGLLCAYTGKLMTGSEFVKWSVGKSSTGLGIVGAWLGGLTMWHWMGIGALVVFSLILGVILFGGSKDSGSGDRAITLASIIGGFALIAALCGFGLMGLDKIGSWFDDEPAPTTQNQVVQQAPVSESKKPTRKELCDAGKVDYVTCRDWGYKK